MPPLVLFNRQWRIATDDFVFPSVVEFFMRSGWIVVISVVLAFHIQELENPVCLATDFRSTTLYLVVSLVLLCITCTNLACLTLYSAKGRMWEPPELHPRRHVSTFLYINILLTVAECLWTLTGTFFAFKDLLRCQSEETGRTVVVVVLVVIFLTYVLLFIKLVVACTAFRPFSTLHAGDERQGLLGSSPPPSGRPESETGLWLRCLNPCSKDENTVEAFKEIAALLSKVFHDADLVPSDILAGLLLMHYKHHKERSLIAEQYHLFSSPAPGENDVKPPELAELKHYYRYAAAAYGYWWYVLDRPVGNFVTLGPRLSCCGSCCCFPCLQLSPDESVVEGDTCCLCNRAAVLAMLQVEEDDLLVFDNRNRLQAVPYFLVLDHQQKSLVIAIRGTLSLHDMLTDLRGDADQMLSDAWGESFGLNAQFRGHKGMVEAARYVYQCLHGTTDGRCCSSQTNETGHESSATDVNGHDVIVASHAGTATTSNGASIIGRATSNGASGAASNGRATTNGAVPADSTIFVGTGRDRAARVNLLGLAMARYPDYSLVVTGHSLGAGTATVLAFLLRCKYPDKDVRCLAYSPPGGLLSTEAATESEKFTLSLVLGDDVIPRTSLANIARLSRDIKAACAGCQLPKYQLLGHSLVTLCCCVRSATIQAEVNRLFPVDEQLQQVQQQPPGNLVGPEPAPAASTTTSTVITIQDLPPLEDRLPGTPSSSGSSSRFLLSPVHQPLVVAAVAAGHLALPLHQHESLVLPGRIYYVEKPKGVEAFRVRVVDRSEFTDILVSPRMLLDHLPNYISRVLDQI